MKFFKRNKECIVKSYVSGEVIPLNEVQDEMFSKGLMGKGIAIEPNDSHYYSPINGKVTMVFPTKHALGIVGDDGYEYLLHIGIDTVELKGKGFETFVNTGSRIKAGDLLLTVDPEFIVLQNYQKTAILCITNLTNESIKVMAGKTVQAKEDLLKIIKES